MTADPASASAHNAPLDPVRRYQAWVRQDMRTRDDLYRQRLLVPRLETRPTISLITPVFNTPPAILRRMLASVRDQTYPHWQHCLVDDGSSEPWLADALARAAAADPRVVVRRRPRNGGIAAASNDALALATGDFAALLDHDDELHPEALYEVARLLNRAPETDVIYSDCDVIDQTGMRCHPFFFPGWSPELLLGLPYLVHLTVYRRSLLQRIGGFHAGVDGAQDYDLALRATAITDRVAHVPRVLYHWRSWSQSAAMNPHAKPYAYEARRRATERYLAARHVDGGIRDLDVSEYHMPRFAIRGEPAVSVVVPLASWDGAQPPDATGVLPRLGRVLAAGDCARHDVTVVGPSDALARLGDWPGDAPLRLVPFDGPADVGSMLSAGAGATTGDHLLWLDARASTARTGWLSAMLELSQEAAIGAVGSRIHTDSGALWHAGIVIPNRRPRMVRQGAFLPANYLAVSGGCLLTRRAVFEATGGPRPRSSVGFVDVDYCLRAYQAGWRVAYMPVAGLTLNAPPADPYAGDTAGQTRFDASWGARIATDPYYNPNFEDDGSFRLRLDREPRRPDDARSAVESPGRRA